jgi:hypothetical protein
VGVVQNPFETIESAQQYVALLIEQMGEVEASVLEDTARADSEVRRVQALQLVSYKLSQLKMHLTASRRMLNDLRVLRRLLLDEREPSRSVTASIQ